MWQSVTAAFENNDEAAAERVEEGEDYIKNKFQQALESDQLEVQERARSSSRHIARSVPANASATSSRSSFD